MSGKVLTTNQRKTPFNENMPGDGVITCRRCKALFEEKESKKKEKEKKELKEKHVIVKRSNCENRGCSLSALRLLNRLSVHCVKCFSIENA